MSAPREEIVRVIAVVPRQRVRLETRLDGASCLTEVLAYPVPLALDTTVRDALVHRRGDLSAVPDAVRAALESHRGEPILAAGVHRFRLDDLAPLAAAFGNAYVTIAATTPAPAPVDDTIAVDDTVAVPDEPPPRPRRPHLLTLIAAFLLAALVSYLLVRTHRGA